MYPNESYDKSLKNAAIAGICVLIFGIFIIVTGSAATQIISSTSRGLLLGILTLLQLLFIPSVALFTYGFAVLGKKYENKWLEVLSYLSIAIGVLSGLIIIYSFYAQAFDANFWNIVLNRVLSSVVNIAMVVMIIPLFSRFGVFVATYAALAVLLDLMGIFGAPANAFAICVQLAASIAGIALLFRAARD